MSRAWFLICLGLGFAGCRKEKAVEEIPPPPPKPQSFAAPADGRVSADRLILWKAADSLVQALDSIYDDSMRAAPEQMARWTAQRDQARDLATREVGLLGWPEYMWILKVGSTLPANAEAFRTAGLGSPVPDSAATH